MALVRRVRSETDRRVVMTTITPSGLDLLARLDEPLKLLLRQQFKRIGRERLAQLIDDLEEIRSR